MSRSPIESVRRAAAALLKRLHASPIIRRVALGAFWTAAGTSISRGLALLSAIVMARLLGKEGFGTVAIVQSTILMFQTVSALGVNYTAAKHVAEFRDTDRLRAARIMGFVSVLSWSMASVLAVSMFFFAPELADSLLNAPQLASALRIGAVAVFFGAIGGVQVSSLAGFEAFSTAAVMTSAAGSVSFLFILAGVRWGVHGVLWGIASGTAMSVAISRWALGRVAARAGIRLSYKGWYSEVGVLKAFGVPALMLAVVTMPPYWFSNVLVARQPGGLAEMGVFSAVYQWRTMLFFIPAVLNSVMVPLLSNLRAKDDHSGYRKALVLNALLSAGPVLIGTIAVWLFTTPILRAYGPEFVNSSAKTALHVIVISALPAAVASVVSQALTSLGRMWHFFLLNLVWGAVLMVCTGALAPGYGAVGLAWAHLIAGLAQMALAMCHVGAVYRKPSTDGASCPMRGGPLG